MKVTDAELVAGWRAGDAPRACDFDEVCRLLASGANVVTTRGELHRAESLDPAVRSRVEAACDRGRASIHSTAAALVSSPRRSPWS